MRIDLRDWGALLFDLDGTLVDTMPLHFRAYAAVLAARRLRLDQADYLVAVGAPAREAIPRFLAACGAPAPDAATVAAIHAEKKAAFAEGLAAGPPAALPAAALLDRAAGRLPLGLVSSGNRAGVSAILAAMGWAARFGVVVTGDDGLRGKPHPDPFLRAAAALGVAPAACLVLEDTADGLGAARAAGMAALDVAEPWTIA